MIDRYRTDDAYLVTILLQIEGKWPCQGTVRGYTEIVVIGLHSAGKSCRRERLKFRISRKRRRADESGGEIFVKAFFNDADALCLFCNSFTEL